MSPGHLSCKGERASCQRLKPEQRRRWRRKKKKKKRQEEQVQVQGGSPVVAEEEEKVQEEEKGGTFGIKSEMYGPLICSGCWRVVRGFALVCVHVCLP